MIKNEGGIEEKSDEVLVEQMLAGKAEAFELLYDRYSTPLFQFFYAKLNDREKAEDFLQNLFMKLLEKGHTFNGKKKFSSWFYTIAHNQCKNEYRNMSRRAVKDDNYDMENLVYPNDFNEAKIDSSIFSSQLNLALNKLSQDHQTSFILRFKHQFSIKEISAVLACSEGTTKSRIFYTLKKLSTELKQFNPYAI